MKLNGFFLLLINYMITINTNDCSHSLPTLYIVFINFSSCNLTVYNIV